MANSRDSTRGLGWTAGFVSELVLDLSRLNNAAQEKWLAFVQFSIEVLGVYPTIDRLSGIPSEPQSNFAYISDSAALSRKLLLNVPLIYIQPNSAPFQIDAYFYWMLRKHGREIGAFEPIPHPVSLISSVFRGDEFLPGFLENCSNLHGYRNCEHFLIRAGSPGMEHARLIAHVQNWPSAIYLNLAQDPGLYEVWNLGARLATGRYLSNANIDDRRAPEHLKHLCEVLDVDSEVDVASTALRVTRQRNLSWEDSTDCAVWFGDAGDQRVAVDGLFKDSAKGLVSRNLPNCMPVWRRSLHARVGRFDEKRYGPSADWAFWLQAGGLGSQFHLSMQSLGLYLRDEESYWHREPENREVDRRIAEEFAPLAEPAPQLGKGHVPARTLGEVLDAALNLLRAGAVYEGVGGLIHAAWREDFLGESAQALVVKVAERFLGCSDFVALAARYRDARSQGHLFELALFNVLTDLVHAFNPETLGAGAARIVRVLGLACIDLHECRGDVRGLLLLALLARRQGDADLEQVVLRHVHRADSAQFWGMLQSVYRFSRPLPELCATVSELPSQPSLERPAHDHQLVYYPSFPGNAYQKLLYQPLLAAGGLVWGTSDEHAFLNVDLLQGADNILHVHWINRLFRPRNENPGVVSPSPQAFLDALAKQKLRGFKVYWTIHNRLSHESADQAVEITFRQALYGLSDRVFVHHPLAASLLDWLPDCDKLCLCEHGHYDMDAAATVSRSEARSQLGLQADDFVVTHLGNIRDYKGLADYLPMILELLAAFPRMKLVIAGRIASNAVRAWLTEHSHGRMIVVDGYLSDEELVRHMRAADFGFLSYSAILTSGSLVHWLSCGRPVLAPAIGTIPGYLVDGWNGFSYRDAGMLRRLLAYCQALPQGECDRLGANALATARQLDWRMWRAKPDGARDTKIASLAQRSLLIH